MHPLLKYLLSFRLLYIVDGGFFFYLLSVFIDPVIIPTLQLPENWCQKWIETRSGYQKQKECVDFNNPLDELKYKHSREMEKRRANKTHTDNLVAFISRHKFRRRFMPFAPP
jgi:hypothetical protein